MFHAGACCVELFFPPIDIQQALIQHTHPVSVPIRHPSDKSFAVTSFETDIYLRRKCNKIPGTYAVYSCVWRLGCFPGVWRRGSWHFQVASLHLLSIMNLCPRHTIFPSYLSKRSGRRMPPAERSALYHVEYRTAVSHTA